MQGFIEFFENNQNESQVINIYLARPDLSVSKIGNMFGLSEREVYRILHVSQINPNRKNLHKEKVQHLHGLGWGIKEIANFTGYSARNVRYILKNPLREHDSAK
jgi:hypothetical protein